MTTHSPPETGGGGGDDRIRLYFTQQCKNGEKCEIVKLFHTLMYRPNLEPVEF